MAKRSFDKMRDAFNSLVGNGKSAPSAASGQSQAHRPAPVGGRPQPRRVPLKEIATLGDIPAHKGILVVDAVSAAEQIKGRDYYLLLEVAGRGFWALAIDQYFQHHHFLTAIEKAEKAGWTLRGRGRITVACLQQLNAALERSAASHHEKGSAHAKDEQNQALFLLQEIVRSAVDKGASDIHVIVRDPNGVGSGTGVVLFRIHGILKKQGESYPSPLLRLMVKCAYSSTSITDANSRDRDQGVYNDHANLKAMMRVECNGEKISLRFQQVVATEGLDAIWRILRTKNVAKLSTLGYESSQQYLMELGARTSNGLVLMVGVTGSGKTTTLMSMLAMDPDNNRTRKVFTVEDPPEYKLFNTTQCFIQRSDHGGKKDNADPFERLMRDLMRADPDVIMLGEIRDVLSGKFAQAAVQSGHGVYGTLHGQGAIEAISRLSSASIGIHRDILCMPGFLSLIVYQKLLRVLCPKCRLPAMKHLPETMIEQIVRFGINPEKVFTRNKEGCPACNNIGAISRTACAEAVLPTRELLQYFHKGEDWKAEEFWRRQRRAPFDHPDMRGKTALEHALFKASLGLVDPVDIDREIAPLETYHIFPINTDHGEGVAGDDRSIAGKESCAPSRYQAAEAEPQGPH